MKVNIGKLNDTWNYTIENNNKKFFLKGVIEGETVDVQIDNTIKINKILTISPNRERKICQYQDSCGGCQGIHMKYEYQLKLKQEMIERLFKENHLLSNNVIKPIKYSNNLKYRNKSQIVFGYNNRKIVAGFYEELSHNIVSVDECILQDEAITKCQKVLKELIEKFHYSIYDESKDKGLIKHILVKTTTLGEVMIVIVTKEEILPGSNNLVKAIVSQIKGVKTIIQNINPKKTTHVLGEKEKILYGKGYIIDDLLGYKFKISSKSFYQINRFVTPILYQEILNQVKNKHFNSIIDAYSGTSTIGIILSKEVNKVTCVELEQSSVNDALENIKNNNIKNVRVFKDDATRFILNMERRKEQVDLVVMDPPRKGSTKEFINSLNKLKPKQIIYVSCDPHTLVNDLKDLIKDYAITSVQPVDMFPNTFHVETVCCLVKTDKSLRK